MLTVAFASLLRNSSCEYAQAVCPDLVALDAPVQRFDTPTCDLYSRITHAEDSKDDDRHPRSPYADDRLALDSAWHSPYIFPREQQQDAIVSAFLAMPSNSPSGCASVLSSGSAAGSVPLVLPERPWLILTGGAMGSGKGWVLRYLARHGVLPLDQFVVCDADKVKSCLPDTHGYSLVNTATAASMVHSESATISEILMRAAVRLGHNVLVDTSLRYYEWFAEYLARVRAKYPHYRLALLVIHAPRAMIHARALRRAAITGRTVPPWLLDASYDATEPAYRMLAPMVDFASWIDNGSDVDAPMPRAPTTFDSIKDAFADSRTGRYCSGKSTPADSGHDLRCGGCS